MDYTLTTHSGMILGKKLTNHCYAEISLENDDLYKLEGDRRGMRLLSQDGHLWITQEGDLKDYWVEPGQSFTIQTSGTVLVQAMPSAHVRVFPKA